MGDTVLLACSALEAYIDAAQARVGTAYPVVYVDKTHHEQPKEMRLRLMKALGAIYQKYCQQFDQEMARMLLDIYFEHYTSVDVIDTGVGDCRSERCRREAEKNVELLRCGLGYVPGSNQMLEKLLSGQWEERLFWVLEPGEVLHSDALCDL